MMIQTTSWIHSLEEGRIQARETGRDLLINIYDPRSDDCSYMQASTYADPRVAQYMDEDFVAVQLDCSIDPTVLFRYHIRWLPCIILLDADDFEYRRSYGVLNAEQFLAEFSLAHGLRLLHSGQYDKAIDALEAAVRYTAVDPHRNAENHYWLGVAKFLATNNKEELEYEWQKLRAEHPSSDWARKTDHYRF